MRRFAIAFAFTMVVLTALVGLVTVSASQPSPYLASSYHAVPHEVIISTRSGQVLTILQIPPGVSLSVHLVKGEWDGPQASGRLTFTGDVSIRTRSSSDPYSGPLRAHMTGSPLRLDVQDAVVVVTPK
jgi:hypothetical protein